MIISKEDTRTPKKIARDARNARIFNDFLKLRSENPTTADTRLFNIIAKRYDLDPMTIRNIIKPRINALA